MPNSASHQLSSRSSEIMARWEKRASTEVLAALKLKSLALRDSLPELLSLIAQVLSTTSSRSQARRKWEEAEGRRVGKQHGRERADCHVYTMSQMISEYHILRQVICDVIEEHQPLAPVEREVIVCAIEQAVNDAATQFSETIKQAQERLAAALTHDLRGPLTVASLATQRILRHPQDATICARSASRISSSVGRLESMIQNLLDASRIRSGKKLSLQLQYFAIQELVDDLAEDFDIVYHGRILISTKTLSIVHWDKAEIFRLIENLTSNAVKYSTSATPISVVFSEKSTNITISVHNEGPPIPSDEHKTLFHQFHRGSGKQQEKGWGIGLTVVKGIAEAHNGQAFIESTKDTGTTFVIELPKNASKPADA